MNAPRLHPNGFSAKVTFADGAISVDCDMATFGGEPVHVITLYDGGASIAIVAQACVSTAEGRAIAKMFAEAFPTIDTPPSRDRRVG